MAASTPSVRTARCASTSSSIPPSAPPTRRFRSTEKAKSSRRTTATSSLSARRRTTTSPPAWSRRPKPPLSAAGRGGRRETLEGQLVDGDRDVRALHLHQQIVVIAAGCGGRLLGERRSRPAGDEVSGLDPRGVGTLERSRLEGLVLVVEVEEMLMGGEDDRQFWKLRRVVEDRLQRVAAGFRELPVGIDGARLERAMHEDEDVGDARIRRQPGEGGGQRGLLAGPDVAVVLARRDGDAGPHGVVRVEGDEGRVAVAEDSERYAHGGLPVLQESAARIGLVDRLRAALRLRLVVQLMVARRREDRNPGAFHDPQEFVVLLLHLLLLVRLFAGDRVSRPERERGFQSLDRLDDRRQRRRLRIARLRRTVIPRHHEREVVRIGGRRERPRSRKRREGGKRLGPRHGGKQGEEAKEKPRADHPRHGVSPGKWRVLYAASSNPNISRQAFPRWLTAPFP